MKSECELSDQTKTDENERKLHVRLNYRKKILPRQLFLYIFTRFHVN